MSKYTTQYKSLKKLKITLNIAYIHYYFIYYKEECFSSSLLRMAKILIYTYMVALLLL